MGESLYGVAQAGGSPAIRRARLFRPPSEARKIDGAETPKINIYQAPNPANPAFRLVVFLPLEIAPVARRSTSRTDSFCTPESTRRYLP
jgi:hypothetical protein